MEKNLEQQKHDNFPTFTSLEDLEREQEGAVEEEAAKAAKAAAEATGTDPKDPKDLKGTKDEKDPPELGKNPFTPLDTSTTGRISRRWN